QGDPGQKGDQGEPGDIHSMFDATTDGIVPMSGGNPDYVLWANGVWHAIPVFAAGEPGLVPASPNTPDAFLAANGDWRLPDVFNRTRPGLVPQAPAGVGITRYLREDGGWDVPVDTQGVVSFNGRDGAVTLLAADISGVGGALLSGPAFTGIPTAPTAGPAANNTQIATTAFVKSLNFAPLADPAFTGAPSAPTPPAGNNSSRIATTAFVENAIGGNIPDVTVGNRVLLAESNVTSAVSGVGHPNVFWQYRNDFDLFEVDIYDFSGSAAASPALRFSNDGTTFRTQNEYAFGLVMVYSGSTNNDGYSVWSESARRTSVMLGYDAAVTYGSGIIRLIFSKPWASAYKAFLVSSATIGAGGTYSAHGVGETTTIAAWYGFQFLMATGNVRQAFIRVYGIKK
ncbi:MAG TPA: hypothetical protein VF778_12145, partial [Xanthobacteraceae bacterium]